MYDCPDFDPVSTSACNPGTNQNSSSRHERAWMDPYIAACGKADSWIMKHIKRDGFLDDVCRHPGVTQERINRMNQIFANSGLRSRLVFRDGNNALHLE